MLQSPAWNPFTAFFIIFISMTSWESWCSWNFYHQNFSYSVSFLVSLKWQNIGKVEWRHLLKTRKEVLFLEEALSHRTASVMCGSFLEALFPCHKSSLSAWTAKKLVAILKPYRKWSAGLSLDHRLCLDSGLWSRYLEIRLSCSVSKFTQLFCRYRKNNWCIWSFSILGFSFIFVLLLMSYGANYCFCTGSVSEQNKMID